MKKIIEALRISVHLLVVRPFLKVVFRSRTICPYRLKGRSQFILIANHNSHLDTLLLFSTIPLRQIPKTRPVAAREYFLKNRVLYGLACFLFNPVWIDRNEKDKAQNRINFLKNQVNAGFSLILFPEGTRGVPGHIGKFKTGVGRLTHFFPHIPILPAYLSGPENAFPKGCRLPLPCPCRIFLGPVQYYSHTPVITTLLLESHLKQMACYFARPKRRTITYRKPATIAVPGIDGSGKTLGVI